MITLIPQSVQSGTITTNVVLAPAGAATVVLQALMNEGDITTPGNVLNLAITWMWDYVTTTHAASIVWQSGYLSLGGWDLGTDARACGCPCRPASSDSRRSSFFRSP